MIAVGVAAACCHSCALSRCALSPYRCPLSPHRCALSLTSALPLCAPRSAQHAHDALPRHRHRHPGDPFDAGASALLAPIRRRRSAGPRRGRSSPAAPSPTWPTEHPRRGRSSTCRAGCCCPGSSTPTCTTRRSGRSAGWACRCSTGWSGARCPRRARLADDAYAEAVAGEFLARAGPGGHHLGAGLRRALRDVRWRSCSARPSAAGCASPPGWCSATGSCRPDLLTTPGRGAGREPQADRALARRGPAALRRDAAVLAVRLGRDARRLRRAAGHADGIWFTSHINENLAEVATVARPVPRRRALPGHLRPARPGHRAQRVRPQRARHATTSWSCWARPAPGPRTARPATPRWAAGCSRSAGTSSTASGRARAPTSAPAPGSPAQGGPAGVLHAAAARRRRAAADPGPSALPGHPGRRAGPRAGRPGRRLRRRQAVRRRLAAARRGQHARGGPAARRDADDALAKIFALATPADVAGVWVGGDQIR